MHKVVALRQHGMARVVIGPKFKRKTFSAFVCIGLKKVIPITQTNTVTGRLPWQPVSPLRD